MAKNITTLDPKFTALDPRTQTYSALIEFRTFAEVKKVDKGEGFAWFVAEGSSVSEIFASAMAQAKADGEYKDLDSASMLMIRVIEQWDENGKLVVLRKWDLRGNKMVAEIVY